MHETPNSNDCIILGSFLSKAANRWTLLIARTLGDGPRRFNALRREIGQISQKMLASTLRDMEENGLITRTVTPTIPPQVEYGLTELGMDFLVPVNVMAAWIIENGARINGARTLYASRDKSGGA